MSRRQSKSDKNHIENDTPSALRNASNADENLVVPERVANVSTSIAKVACGAAYTILLSINGDVFISGKLGKYSSKTFEIIRTLSFKNWQRFSRYADRSWN